MAEKTPEEMREAVLAIREKMAAAAREAGRDPAEVQLCAACKTRTAETVAASAALPIDVFGENHVQELCANFDAGAYCGKPSHFIGHLQTNKIQKVLGRTSLIQSVGSEHLLTAIEKEAARAGIVQNVLLEVNIGGEESKSGVSPEALWPLLDAAAAQEHIRVKGLMAIPPVNDDDAQNRRYLAAVHDLFVKAGEARLFQRGDADPLHGHERRLRKRHPRRRNAGAYRHRDLRRTGLQQKINLSVIADREVQIKEESWQNRTSKTPVRITTAAACSSAAFYPIWQSTRQCSFSTCSAPR